MSDSNEEYGLLKDMSFWYIDLRLMRSEKIQEIECPERETA